MVLVTCKFDEDPIKNAGNYIRWLMPIRPIDSMVCSVLSEGSRWLRSVVTKWIKSCLLQCFGTFKMPILMFISILVFRPEGQI